MKFTTLSIEDVFKKGLPLSVKHNYYFNFPMNFIPEDVRTRLIPHIKNERMRFSQSFVPQYNEEIPQYFKDLLFRMYSDEQSTKCTVEIEDGWKPILFKQNTEDYCRSINKILENQIPKVDFNWLKINNMLNEPENPFFTIYPENQFDRIKSHNESIEDALLKLDKPYFVFYRSRKNTTGDYILDSNRTTHDGNIWLERKCISHIEFKKTVNYYKYNIGYVIVFNQKDSLNFQPKYSGTSLSDVVYHDIFNENALLGLSEKGTSIRQTMINNVDKLHMLDYVLKLSEFSIITEYYGRNTIRAWYFDEDDLEYAIEETKLRIYK